MTLCARSAEVFFIILISIGQSTKRQRIYKLLIKIKNKIKLTPCEPFLVLWALNVVVVVRHYPFGCSNAVVTMMVRLVD